MEQSKRRTVKTAACGDVIPLTPDQLDLARYMHPPLAITGEVVHVYGSRNRPMLGSWARIADGAAHITLTPDNPSRDGGGRYHTYTLTAGPMLASEMKSYELELVWSGRVA